MLHCKRYNLRHSILITDNNLDMDEEKENDVGNNMIMKWPQRRQKKNDINSDIEDKKTDTDTITNTDTGTNTDKDTDTITDTDADADTDTDTDADTDTGADMDN